MWRGVFIAAAIGAGCNNPCQALCNHMADYAQEECGFDVSDAEIDACIERQGQELTPEDREACRELGGPEVIPQWWTCDDLAPYWSAGAGATTP